MCLRKRGTTHLCQGHASLLESSGLPCPRLWLFVHLHVLAGPLCVCLHLKASLGMPMSLNINSYVCVREALGLHGHVFMCPCLALFLPV